MEMDSEKLFETMTVDEVKRMLQDTRVNIERKKEELRFLVGERYRDIIEAADTISEMKDNAEKINASIVRLNDVCNAWHKDIYLSSRAPKSNGIADQRPDHSSKLAVAAQVKALLDMPELLWSAVEREQHSRAAVLFLSARHIFTHLQVGNESRAARANVLPLAGRQWSALLQFREVVVRGARASLRQGITPEEQICDSLGSLVLLNSLTLEQVFEEYLSSRKSAIEFCVSTDNASSSARAQITAGVDLLLSSVRQISDLFSPDEEGQSLLQRTLAQSVSKSLLEQTEMSDRLFTYLPATVSQFRPSLSQSQAALDSDFLRRATSSWFNDCMAIFGPSVRALMSHINSVKALNDIRDTVTANLVAVTAKDEAWATAAAGLLDGDVDIWRSCLKPIFMERLETVLKSALLDLFDRVFEEAEAAGRENPESEERAALDSFDLNAWLWAEASKDVSATEVWSAGGRFAKEPSPLGRKLACLSPTVQRIASNLDERLSLVRNDLMLEKLEEEEREEIQKLVTAALLGSVERFLSWVASRQEEAAGLPSPACRARFLFYSRLCGALLTTCPALKLCLDPASGRPPARGSRASSNPAPAWQQTCSQVAGTANQLVSSWLQKAFQGIAARFEETMSSYRDPLCFLELCPKWDEVQLEGAPVRVPCQASWHVHRLLASLCEELNACGAHVIAMSVLQSSLQSLSAALLRCLQSLSDSSRPLSQPQALQLLFDARFLFSALPCKDQAGLEVCFGGLESAIDPFDLDVASQPMQAHLTQLRARCGLIYGLLLGLHDRLGALSGWAAPVSQTASDEHQLLARGSGQGVRFALLPSSGPLVRPAGPEEAAKVSARPVKKGTNRTYSRPEVKEETRNNSRFKDVYRFGSKLFKVAK